MIFGTHRTMVILFLPQEKNQKAGSGLEFTPLQQSETKPAALYKTFSIGLESFWFFPVG